MRNILFCLILLALFNTVFSQKSTHNIYQTTFIAVDSILNKNGNFKDAVESVEFLSLAICPKKDIDSLFLINEKLLLAILWNTKLNYHYFDSINFVINNSIFDLFSDSLNFILNQKKLNHLPFSFNHSDPLGKQDITNTFVSKLLTTHQGNCRSLTYLYKILADELGAKCWIALAPGHMYVKNYSEKIGWYNTELTSGTFPTDAWLMASTYISGDAVKSGLYMDTLSNQQAIALCVLDLANIYESQTHNYYDGFISKCCDLVLKYHPVNPMALLLKAETHKKIVINEKTSKYPKITATEKEMEATYLKLLDLGYREMPDKMYKQWLKNLKRSDQKSGYKIDKK